MLGQKKCSRKDNCNYKLQLGFELIHLKITEPEIPELYMSQVKDKTSKFLGLKRNFPF